jgi:hypothetical protein
VWLAASVIIGVCAYVAFPSSLSETKIRRQFLREHRGATIFSIGDVYGDHDSAVIPITYQPKRDTRTEKELWHYISVRGGWRLARKEKLVPAESRDLQPRSSGK